MGSESSNGTAPGFARELYDKVFDADIFSHAAQVAFYFSFALFPFLYFLVSLFGLVLDASADMKSELFGYLRQVMPYSVFELVRRTVDEIIENSSSGKVTLGLAVTLWSASAGIDAIRNALNAVFSLKETRTWFRTKAEAIALTIIVAVLSSLAVVLVFYGWNLFQAMLATMGLGVNSPAVSSSLQWITLVLVLLIVCEVFFNLLPNYKRLHWQWITPGSVVAIVIWIVLTAGFRTYLSFYNSYDRAYGSLGAMMIMMLWLYLSASALMIGAAINAVLHHRREARLEAEAESSE